MINNNNLSNKEIINGLRSNIKQFPTNRNIRDIIADRLDMLIKENIKLEKNIINLIIENNNMHNKCGNIFYIPEILDKIIYFIYDRKINNDNIRSINKDLLKTMYVNKLWYSVSHWYIWRNMDVINMVKIYKQDKNMIDKYSNKIRKLYLNQPYYITLNELHIKIIKMFISKINNLTHLEFYVDRRKLNINILEPLFKKGTLEYMSFSDVSSEDVTLSDDHFIEIACCKNLRYLNLKGCKNNITDKTISSMSLNCPSLSYLSVESENITDSSIKMLALHTNLNTIFIDNCNITDISVYFLMIYNNIVKLGVSNTRITNDTLYLLYLSPTLKYIDIRKTIIDNYSVIYDLVFKKGIEFMFDYEQREDYNKWLNKNMKRKSFQPKSMILPYRRRGY